MKKKEGKALSSFHHLEVLDLSGNNFVGSIPSTIQELSSLKVLSFAGNNLNGSLRDHGLCELRNLNELDLSYNMFDGSVPQCFNRLSSLTLLDISSNAFTGTLTPSPITNLTSLKYVDFGDNLFEGSFSFSSLSNNTMLEVVRFMSNKSEFEVETEEPTGWIPMFQLKVLVISGCNMNRLKGGIVPGFLLHQHELQEVDLSDNSLVGPFPNWLIEKNTMLEDLILSQNSFSGIISMPFYMNANIRWLDMSGNHLNGSIPDDIQKFLPMINYLNLSSNSLDGVISSSVGDMRELRTLDLSDNLLSGEVPNGMFSNLPYLLILKLSKNRLQGQVLSGNVSLGSIERLHLDSNCFTGKIGNANISSPYLRRLDIGSNSFTGMIPHWISNMSALSALVVRNNSFEGQFPCGTASFVFFDISHNSFSGPIPSCSNFRFTSHFHLGYNRLSGSIPNFFSNLTHILTLDIGNNLLSGRMPEFLGELSDLRILILRNNNFSGSIPKQLCQLSEVSLIDLSANSLSGSIPSCLHNIIKPFYPTFIEKQPEEKMSGSAYEYAGVLHKYFRFPSSWLEAEVADEVLFTTKTLSYPYKGRLLDLMSGLDLSCNRLTGEIPEELGLLTEIHALNLSHNQLYGRIPVNFSNLANIESLDLSSNNLSGEVPSGLVKLNTLAVFNVSYNNLSGRLPETRGQFATFSKESYEGNPLLCGPPLEKNCTATSQVTNPSAKEEDDKWYDIDFLASFYGTWVVFMLGFAGVLYVNPYWRRRWLEFVEECMYTCYYFLEDSVRKLINMLFPTEMECWCVSKMKYPWLMMIMMIGSVMVYGIEGGCIEEEREALLEIKTSLIHSYVLSVDPLPSWVDVGRECCDWERVICNSTTGHVSELSFTNMMGRTYEGGMLKGDRWGMYVKPCEGIWSLNVSLFLHFKELTGLNLSSDCLDNNIVSTGLEKLSSLKKLKILDISHNSIGNEIFSSLGAFVSLRILHLGDNKLEGCFPALGMFSCSPKFLIFAITCPLKNLEVLDLTGTEIESYDTQTYGMQGFEKVSMMKNLKILNLGYNDFNESLITSLSALPSLKSLNLKSNGLFGFPAQELSHLTNLEELDLSGNRFYDTPNIQDCRRLSRMKRLKSIGLRDNMFNKNIISCLSALHSLEIFDLSNNPSLEELSYLAELKVLLLSRNVFNGTLPEEALASFYHLEVLDLSSNRFTGSIPSTIRALSSLRVVSFANNLFNGSLPDHGLCELKNLHELDISRNRFDGNLPYCFSGLSFLKMLDISSNRFTGLPIPSMILNLTRLEYVDFSNNKFEGSFSFNLFSNHTRLEVVRFMNDNDKFDVDTEEPIGWNPMFQLKVLVLSGCNINRHKESVVPRFLLHQRQLQILDLSHNSLVGQFPNWLIENNTKLKALNLRNNSFIGIIYMPLYRNANMRWLDISENHMMGTISSEIQKFLPNMIYLNLSRNNLEGAIPSSISDLNGLRVLDLSDNDFSKEVPKGLFTNLSSLQVLRLSKNRLHGQVLSGDLKNFGKIDSVFLDSNCFTGEIGTMEIGNWTSENWYMQNLDIGNNFFTGTIPSWISNSQLSELVVRNNSFQGRFPCGTTSFDFLDISQNSFMGPIPSCLNFQYTRHLHLGSNGFTGSIPNVFRNLTNVLTLDLGNNFLSGRIPKFLGELSDLRILILRKNNFSGSIPKQLCQLSSVSLIDLSGNSISDSIPRCLHNIVIPINPIFIDGYTLRISFYDYQSVLYDRYHTSYMWGVSDRLDEVQFTTKTLYLPFKGRPLDLMAGLDLSCNKLTGEIPEELGLLTQIHSLNLSHNQLFGPIPRNFSNLVNIESLDLSSNNLSGELPSELIKLNTLAVFNVSYNKLSGRLPDMKAQFGTFTEESYEGNPLLCGPPLEKKCAASTSQVNDQSTKEDNDKWYDDIDFLASFYGTWVVFMLGFAGVLYVNPYWRRRWLEFVEECMYTCYYFLEDSVRKVSRLFRK
ncbi:hypothetical protein OSB04_006209 [Centaurea solstitialis]|uniref:Leucine-rich repeat-containing N-terminal plant-type domain-containing protein n=1 Tax=Centaurea solstitialis TaxID=347529 RepID=A0AA38WRW3_9ASTR|nr:hypothetical protein OSB04_006209 [Centaurea solstitialis]